jgi:hypothetical protein
VVELFDQLQDLISDEHRYMHRRISNQRREIRNMNKLLRALQAELRVAKLEKENARLHNTAFVRAYNGEKPVEIIPSTNGAQEQKGFEITCQA